MRYPNITSYWMLASFMMAGPMLYADEPAAPAKTVKAPDFVLANYDGKECKLADYKGKIVVLEWFNYDCPFVKYHYEKAATMKDLAAKYKDKNVVWLAINSTSTHERAKDKEFAEKYAITYPILDDTAGKVGREYGATNTPHIYIIDTERNIVYSGAIDNAPLGKPVDGAAYVNYVEKALEELTAGKTITTAETKPYGCTVKYAK